MNLHALHGLRWQRAHRHIESETRSMAVLSSMFWWLHLVLLLHHTGTTHSVFTLWSRPHIPFLILQSPWLQFYRHIQPYGQCRVWFYCDATLFRKSVTILFFIGVCSFFPDWSGRFAFYQLFNGMHWVSVRVLRQFFSRPIVLIWMLVAIFFSSSHAIKLEAPCCTLVDHSRELSTCECYDNKTRCIDYVALSLIDV